MDLQKELDPRVKGFETKLKLAGVAAVAVLASAVVILGGLTFITAGIVALGALAMVNLIPVAARWMALKKEQAMTHLHEEFSEETIREDERQEGDRLSEQQALYATQSAEFGNVIDELKSSMGDASDEERALLQGQIDQLNGVLVDAEVAINQKIADLAELKRVNKIYVGLHRAAKVMKRSQDLERNATEIQRVETARNAIKTRMREALAGQKLDAMNAPLRERLSVGKVAQIASSPLTVDQPVVVNAKEVTRVPTGR